MLAQFYEEGFASFFVLDNIDFTEDTAYGQNSLHGSVIVISQDDDLAESIAGPVKIPDKAGCSRINYKFRDNAWALTNYLANDINDMDTSNAGIESDSQDLDETRVSNEARTSANFDALMENSQIDDNLNDCSNKGENTILSINRTSVKIKFQTIDCHSKCLLAWFILTQKQHS